VLGQGVMVLPLWSCRLSEQAQKQLLGSEKFEDILLGNQRPTQVTQAYGELFSQARVEALEEVDAIVASSPYSSGLKANFTSQLLLEVLTVSGRCQEVARLCYQLYACVCACVGIVHRSRPCLGAALCRLEV